MSAIAVKEPSALSEKPVHDDDNDTVKFPPLPDPTDDDFDDDVLAEEREFYKNKFKDLNEVKHEKLHCTACDRHLGCSARNESRMRSHPMLRTLMCHTCHSFYNSGEFDKGDDGSELYCRWCGQGGQVYCCSDCPIVFCAKCIKRNFGVSKIKEIENTDDWKCFKCKPKCLWDHRAVCWALLRFCDLRNKLTYQTQDPKLKEAYQKLCAEDETECCKSKGRRKEKELKRKAENEAVKKTPNIKIESEAKKVANSITKLPPAIQVKKFASINLEESPPKQKKKRPSSPNIPPKPLQLKQVSILPNRMINPIAISPLPAPKKIRVPNIIQPPHSMATVRFPQSATFPRIRPAKQPLPISMVQSYNNFNHTNMMNNPINDNINLSLDSLTQGLDMAVIANMTKSMSNNNVNDDVVCTPDFPLEPLCEVTEENNDDDVECITPGPVVPPVLIKNPPPLIPRNPTSSKEVGTDNIIQMTEDDVTVNEATGGLKFRVDPQTLSSNKMYRLPDGRVFAIHANPSMPGGYSATIVAVAENSTIKSASRGASYAAKLNTISSTPSPTRNKPSLINNSLMNSTSEKLIAKRGRPFKKKKSSSNTSERMCDMKVPIEWYRYNLIDAVDALQYSLTRLEKLKKQATTTYLRSRNVEEMRSLHKTLDSLLKTSASRFSEIRDNLNSDMKKFVSQKTTTQDISDDDDDDDDDVEILNDTVDDPIFIDENSLDSNNANETNSTNDVDLTGAGSSEHNESGDKIVNDNKDPLAETNTHDDTLEDKNESAKSNTKGDQKLDKENIDEPESNTQPNKLSEENSPRSIKIQEINGDIDHSNDKDNKINNKEDDDSKENDTDNEIEEGHAVKDNDADSAGKNDDPVIKDYNTDNATKDDDTDNNVENDTNENRSEATSKEDGPDEDETQKKGQDESLELADDKSQDAEMTDELIENLLKDDNCETSNCMEIPEDFQEP